MENPCQTIAQEREGGKLHSPPDLVLSWLPLPHTQTPLWPSPCPLFCVQKGRSGRALHRFGGNGKRRVAEGVGRGSQGNRMNLFSRKHGVQTGGFLLSCFTSVKASINSTLIIKSEQCVFGFQQLNSVTAVSLGSLASFTT